MPADSRAAQAFDALRAARDEIAREGLSPDEVATVRRMVRAVRQAWPEVDPDATGALLAALDAMNKADVLHALSEYLKCEPAAPAQGVQILCVEDDPATAGILEGILGRSGREIVVAASAAEALELLERRPPALAILDLSLPDDDGRNLLVRIRESFGRASLPVVVLTGNERARAECSALGADAFLGKPVQIAEVSAVVEDLLRYRVDRTASRETGKEKNAGPLAILLAEDDELNAAVVTHRLEREGYVVRHFVDGATALEEADNFPFALAILDVKMPKMDGFDLLRRLRETSKHRSVPVLMLTSLRAERDVVHGLSLGADDYLAKPFSPTELVARVRKLLRPR